jgi:Zn ribbon nucleic-acid-binding protein
VRRQTMYGGENIQHWRENQQEDETLGACGFHHRRHLTEMQINKLAGKFSCVALR